MDRGLLYKDENFLKQVAAEKCEVFLVRDSSLPALRWVGRDGYKPKPQDIKGKTLKEKDFEGLGLTDTQKKQYLERFLGLASARGMKANDIAALKAIKDRNGNQVYFVQPFFPELIVDRSGSKFYSDTDLHGVYDVNGKSAWSEELLRVLQCGTLDKGIQHGPHDEWPDRNDKAKAGGNYGPQIGRDEKGDCGPPKPGEEDKPCRTITAIFPDGTTLKVCSLDQMKQLYRAIGVNFKAVYPAF